MHYPRLRRLVLLTLVVPLVSGCSVPTSIGLAMVDEVNISTKDLAIAALLSECCGKAGFESEDTFTKAGIEKLSQTQRKQFDKWQNQHRHEIKQSVDKKACAAHAKESRSVESKIPVITD